MNPRYVANLIADDMFESIVASRAVPQRSEIEGRITAEPTRFGQNFTEGEIRSIYSHFTRRCDTILKGNRGAPDVVAC